MGTKPPAIAAVISLFLPGVGHFYSGAWARGLGALALSYLAIAVFGAALGRFAGAAYLALALGVAYDAYKTAARENERELAEAVVPVERDWLLWAWGLMRAGWISVFFLVFGLAAVGAVIQALKSGRLLPALVGVFPMIFFTALAWLAAASTYRVMNGTQAMSRRSVRNEFGSTIFFGGILVLMAMIVAPAFTNLVRKSGEGAMKGRLQQLRAAFTRYRVERSENPPSLEALAGPGNMPELPALWPNGIKVPHASGRGTIALPDGKPTDSGKWAYAVGTSTPIFIDCTHTDTRGSAWASY